jgi:hypothetical protein
MYPSVKDAWTANGLGFRADMTEAFKQVDKYLIKKAPRLFRIHIAGDFLNQAHVDGWRAIAKKHTGTQFLAFTKMHSLNYSKLPNNFTVIFSMFPAMPMPDSKMPIAWMQDGTEDRIPKRAIKCSGTCDSCGVCFYAKKSFQVYFKKH